MVPLICPGSIENQSYENLFFARRATSCLLSSQEMLQLCQVLWQNAPEDCSMIGKFAYVNTKSFESNIQNFGTIFSGLMSRIC